MPMGLRWLARVVMILFLLSAIRLPREIETDIWTNRGDTAFESRNYSAAIACYDKAREFSPNSSLLESRLKDVAEDRKDPGSVDRKKVKEALESLRKI